jgi:glycosyltransferase involved in cell wall biosynthesis
MAEVRAAVDVSVIIPVGARHDDLTTLCNEYRRGLDALGRSYETIVVLDGPRPGVSARLKELCIPGANLTVLSLARSFGEATALMAGFLRARGSIVITLPAYYQIESEEIPKLVAGLDSAELVIGHRWPRRGGRVERLRRRLFHGLIHWVTGLRFRDLGCGARAMNRRVLEEIALYGDQHRFLPLLATRQGFRVREVDVRQSPADSFRGTYRTREYTHRILDIFTVFFLVRFTKKPLRFFGMIGVSMFVVGAALITWLVIERLFFAQALAERPALLLASLLAVLGLQLFAIGLLGELVIFTHARAIKDYQVQEVISFGSTEVESQQEVELSRGSRWA